MVGVLRTLGVASAAYVLCPMTILVIRANRVCGVSIVATLGVLAAAQIYARQ